MKDRSKRSSIRLLPVNDIVNTRIISEAFYFDGTFVFIQFAQHPTGYENISEEKWDGIHTYMESFSDINYWMVANAVAGNFGQYFAGTYEPVEAVEYGEQHGQYGSIGNWFLITHRDFSGKTNRFIKFVGATPTSPQFIGANPSEVHVYASG